MRTSRHLIRIASVSALLVAGVFGSKSARAEVDTFGLGSGRTGALTVTTANTVVNGYASITSTVAFGATTVHVDNGATFAPGDLVMLWQTSGLTLAPLSGIQTATDVSLIPTGSFEYARVKSVNTTTNVVTLTNPIVTTLGFVASTTQLAQMVRIPEYTTVSIASGKSIVATPWNGAKGGIVAFFATGTVTNDASAPDGINADGAGYRGGVLLNDAVMVSSCIASDGPVVDTVVPSGVNPLAGGAKKGEGFYPPDYSTDITNPTTLTNAVTYGRGNISLGGGGGDCFNAGGGGGGNAGQGGLGGATATGEVGGGGRSFGGLGGGGVDTATYNPLSRLTFGGGAGAGEEDSNLGSVGATGGGVVLMRISALAGTGAISADGSAGSGAATTDGAGGGGAGGLVVVLTSNDATCGGLHANGGAGGMAGAGFGPGGGGGGGFVLLQAATKSCTAAESGGAFGTDGTTARQATAGVGGFTVPPPAGGFTGAPCILGSGNCGGCVLNLDCTTPYTCDVLTNMCTDFFPDGGLIPDGGLLLPDGGLGFLDAGTDGGLLTDAGSGSDGGSGTDGGSGSDGGFFDGGSFDGGNVTADGGNGNQNGGGDDDNTLEGGGCSSSGSSSDGNGAAVISLGLVAALAFMRRKHR